MKINFLISCLGRRGRSIEHYFSARFCKIYKICRISCTSCEPCKSCPKIYVATGVVLFLATSSLIFWPKMVDLPTCLAPLMGGFALDAPPGREHLRTDMIMRDMPGWKRDHLAI